MLDRFVAMRGEFLSTYTMKTGAGEAEPLAVTVRWASVMVLPFLIDDTDTGGSMMLSFTVDKASLASDGDERVHFCVRRGSPPVSSFPNIQVSIEGATLL